MHPYSPLGNEDTLGRLLGGGGLIVYTLWPQHDRNSSKTRFFHN